MSAVGRLTSGNPPVKDGVPVTAAGISQQSGAWRATNARPSFAVCTRAVQAASAFGCDDRDIAVLQDLPRGLECRSIDHPPGDEDDVIALEQPPDQRPAAHLDLGERDCVAVKLTADDHGVEPVDVVVIDDARACLGAPATRPRTST